MFSFVVLSILFLGAHRVGGLWAVFIIRFIIGCWVWKRVSAIFLCLYIINIIIFSVFSKDISNFKTFSQMNSLIILIKIIIALMDFIWLLFFFLFCIYFCLFVCFENVPNQTSPWPVVPTLVLQVMRLLMYYYHPHSHNMPKREQNASAHKIQYFALLL